MSSRGLSIFHKTERERITKKLKYTFNKKFSIEYSKVHDYYFHLYILSTHPFKHIYTNSFPQYLSLS